MSEHVLIVDDENANLYMIETLLKGHGFQVTAAENGRDALEKARLSPPDLIITDILMPEMDGYALCREWKSDDTLKQIPLIFYTATYTDPADEAFALSLGADRFILKPQEPEVLISILHEVLQRTCTVRETDSSPLGEEMEFFRQHNEVLFKKLEKKMEDLETVNRELRRSEERYRMIAEKMTDLVWLADMDLRTTYVTPSVQAVLGFTPEERMSQTVDQQFTPESLAYGMDALARELALEEEGSTDPDRVAHLVLEYYHKDGSTRWMDTDITGIRDDRGILTGLYGVSRDVTARKQAEEELKDTKELYQLLFEDAPYGVVILEPEAARIVEFNEKACLQLGYSREEFAELHVSDLEAIESPEETKAKIAQVMHEGRIDFETRHRTKQGELRDVKVTSQYTEIQGKPIYHCVWHDITDLKKAEEALRDSEQRYRMIVENMHDSISLLGLDLNYLYQSPSESRISGYTPEEIMAIPLQDQMTAESYRLAQEVLAEEIELEFSGTPVDPHRSRTMELEVYHKKGGTVWEEATASFQRDEKGNPVGILLTGRDITDRKRAEEELRKSERKYRTILEEMEEGYWEVDLAGRYISCNDALCKIHGFPPEKLMKMTFRDYTDPETAKRISKICNQAYRTGKPGRIGDHEIIREDGSTGMVEFNVSLMRDDWGNPVGFRGITRDITKRIQAEQELRESEEKYRTILESIEDGYWEVDLRGRYTFCNDGLCNLTGFSREELLGKRRFRYTDPDTAKKAYRIFNEIYRTGRQADVTDYQFAKKDGSMAIHELSVSLRRDAEGNPIGFRGISRDVTERRAMEEALAESERRYRMIVENMHDSITLLDFDMNYLYQSPSGVRVSGYTPEEIKAIPAQDYMTPESFHLAQQVLAEELALEFSGSPVDLHRSRTMELEIYHKEGGTVWEEATVSFQRDEQGKPIAILLTSSDITDRKRAEEQLRESEEKYRTILESIEDAYWEVDLVGTFTFFNDALSRLTGFPPEEILGTSWFAQAVSETIKKVSGTFNEVYRTGIPANVEEYQFTKKDGSMAIHELSVSLRRDAEGNPIGFQGISRDVTERRTMEEALAESEQRYRMIVENMSEIIWIVTPDLQFNYVSPSNAWVTGYTPDEARETPLDQLLTPESFAYATRRLADEIALEKSGEPFDPNRVVTLEIEAVNKEGGTFWLEISGTFNRNTDAEITEILVVGKNINDRKQAEEALEESEKRYRMIVENMQDIVWTMGLDFSYTYRSPSNIRITGYNPEEITSTPIKEQMTPESYALVERILAEELEKEFGPDPVDSHRSRTMELEVYHKNGGTVWIEVTGTFLRDEQGNPVEVLLAARDVTERKRIAGELRESEQRYRMIVENMHDVIMVVGLDLTERYRSPSAAQLTGYRLEELAGIPLQEQVAPESYALAQQILGEELEKEFGPDPADPHRSRVLEMEVYHKNGGTIWVEETATFLRDDEGKPEAILLAIRDVTERKRLEKEKGKLEGQLIQAQKMETVGRLAGGVAHDFNNMLSVILGYVDLAKLSLVKEHPVLKDIVEIEKAAIRSRDITSQLLAFSRKQIIAPKVINLNDLVVNTEKSLTRLIGEDIDLRVHLEEEPWMIKFDPSQIEQILINLAVNARDAMPDGGKLTIETENVVVDESYCRNHIGFTPDDYVQLSVSDNGVGMNRETLDHIFEPFFTTKGVGKGTGLGMATVYGIIKQNNGYINVYSEPGHGTTFTIYLPRTTEGKEVREEDEKETLLSGVGNILLVEDDPMVLEIAKGMLESIGYSVIVAETPHDAVTLYQNHDTPISLVMTDVVMPSMSGKELIDRLNEIRPNTRALFMSGYTADAIAHHGVLEQGVHFLQKPFRLGDLARKVREAMVID